MAWAPDYATPEEMKAYVRINDLVDDAEVGFAIAAASRAVDRTCNRQFGLVAAPEVRHYTAEWDVKRCRWQVGIDDLMTEVGLLVAYDGSPVTDFTLQPVNSLALGRPWTKIIFPSGAGGKEDAVKVTARFGWTTVPTPIVQATLLQASRVLARRDSPYGVAGSPDQGSEVRLLAKLDADVAVAVGPYRRWWAAA